MKTGTGWMTSAVKNSENICEQTETKKALPRRAGFAAENREARAVRNRVEKRCILSGGVRTRRLPKRRFRIGTQAVSVLSSDVQWGHLVASAGISLLQ